MAQLAIQGGSPVRTRPIPPWPVFDERDEQALLNTLHSREWGIGAHAIDSFEHEFAIFCGANHAVTCTNGTDAIYIAMQALGIGPGDEVIIPPYTFIATAIGVLMAGAVPVFADIHPKTCNIDPEAVRAVITPRTKAIIPVHIAGNPADLDGILSIAKEHNLLVMEDAAQAHGAEWRNQRVGPLGHLGTFSFQSSKNLSSGEGGALVTNDEEIAERVRTFVNCGRVKGGAWYDHHELAGNHRLGAFQAALLRVGLERIEEQMQHRSENACYLARRLEEIEGIEMMGVHDGCTRHAYHLCVLHYDAESFGGVSKPHFVKALAQEGIDCADGYLPLYRYHYFQHFAEKTPAYETLYKGRADYRQVNCPVVERICNHEALWIFHEMLLDDRRGIDDIAEAILKIQRNIDELRMEVA